MKKTLLFILMGIIMVVFSNPSLADDIDMKGKIGIGLNYPGISVRYGLDSKLVIEVKSQSADGVSIIGSRLYYYQSRKSDKLISFIGAEYSMLSFKGEVSDGSGTALGVFIGGEYSTDDKLSLGLDIGPTMISLSDSGSSESVSGIEFVISLFINYYIQ